MVPLRATLFSEMKYSFIGRDSLRGSLSEVCSSRHFFNIWWVIRALCLILCNSSKYSFSLFCFSVCRWLNLLTVNWIRHKKKKKNYGQKTYGQKYFFNHFWWHFKRKSTFFLTLFFFSFSTGYVPYKTYLLCKAISKCTLNQLDCMPTRR